jgi:hypothetical protein
VRRAESETYNWILAHRDYPHENWCLMWPFFRDKHGRGVIHQDGEHYAHRLMCKLVKGEPPTPEHGTAHSCGAGHLGCINPHHLSWKTQAENLGDCAAHGTQPKNRVGSCGHFSRHEVEQIRRLLETHTHLAIAQMYRVTESTISDIARGRYYAREPKLNFWTPEEDAKIKDCMERGLNFRQMAEEIGRPMPSVMGRAYRIGLKSGVPPIPKKDAKARQGDDHG